jgi:hypothetical protein
MDEITIRPRASWDTFLSHTPLSFLQLSTAFLATSSAAISYSSERHNARDTLRYSYYSGYTSLISLALLVSPQPRFSLKPALATHGARFLVSLLLVLLIVARQTAQIAYRTLVITRRKIHVLV